MRERRAVSGVERRALRAVQRTLAMVKKCRLLPSLRNECRCCSGADERGERTRRRQRSAASERGSISCRRFCTVVQPRIDLDASLMLCSPFS